VPQIFFVTGTSARERRRERPDVLPWNEVAGTSAGERRRERPDARPLRPRARCGSETQFFLRLAALQDPSALCERRWVAWIHRRQTATMAAELRGRTDHNLWQKWMAPAQKQRKKVREKEKVDPDQEEVVPPPSVPISEDGPSVTSSTAPALSGHRRPPHCRPPARTSPRPAAACACLDGLRTRPGKL
jgi:hypothetical protein